MGYFINIWYGDGKSKNHLKFINHKVGDYKVVNKKERSYQRINKAGNERHAKYTW